MKFQLISIAYKYALFISISPSTLYINQFNLIKPIDLDNINVYCKLKTLCNSLLKLKYNKLELNNACRYDLFTHFIMLMCLSILS